LRPDNGSLAEHPDHFAFVLSPAKTAAFAAVGTVLLVVAVVALINLGDLNTFGAENAGGGRNSRVLGPYLGYIVVGLGAIFGGWALVHAFRTGIWTLADGRALKQRAWVMHGDLDSAHQRLATTDPSVYLPLPVSRRSDNLRRRLRAYTAEGLPVTYLTVTMGVGNNERHWPLLTFEGAAHEAFQRLQSQLGKPYQG
jgi:hypothetical protein